MSDFFRPYGLQPQSPLSMGFSRQEYWTQGSNLCVLCLLHWQVDSLPLVPPIWLYWDFPGSSDSKESACNAGDQGFIAVSGRSPEERNGNPLQYSCLENPHGQRSLASYSPQGHKVSDTTDQLILSLSFRKKKSNNNNKQTNPNGT